MNPTEINRFVFKFVRVQMFTSCCNSNTILRVFFVTFPHHDIPSKVTPCLVSVNAR
jgi:hypothetical protein